MLGVEVVHGHDEIRMHHGADVERSLSAAIATGIYGVEQHIEAEAGIRGARVAVSIGVKVAYEAIVVHRQLGGLRAITFSANSKTFSKSAFEGSVSPKSIF